MSTASSPPTSPLQESFPLKNTAQRSADLVVLFLLLSLLVYRTTTFFSVSGDGAAHFAAFLCEFFFTFSWILVTNCKWNPVEYRTFPRRLLKQVESLPAVDMLVTTADPKLEPPIITINTVLSLMAADYPAEKLACYVSDDGGSPETYYALVEASKFAKMWVPFCKKYEVRVRAPFAYFGDGGGGGDASRAPEGRGASPEFERDLRIMKSEYEKLRVRVEEASKFRDFNGEEFAEFLMIDRRNHGSIVKIIHENSEVVGIDGIPHLVYVSREKRPKHQHHFKAGAMNVLTRVSAVMTNAPFMLNVDCDMFANNPDVLLHGICLLLGFPGVESRRSGFVQTKQIFHDGLPDDPFGNQLVVLQQKLLKGMVGIQGPFYAGTGCFHRRKIMYGAPPPETGNSSRRRWLSLPEKKEKVFGDSEELLRSVELALSGNGAPRSGEGLAGSVEVSLSVASCTFEKDTCWGKEIGWVYGSMTEDVLTGLRIHGLGWQSVMLTPDPPPFLGSAPTGGPAALTQYKRWATGLLEVLFSPGINPFAAAAFGKLRLRQLLAYLTLNLWAVRSVFELCYALLPAYCLISDTAIWPKATEPSFLLPLAIFLVYNLHTMSEYLECGLSLRSWWNNQRMQIITATTAWLLGFFSVILNLFGLSESVFEVTRKDRGGGDDGGDLIDAGDEDPTRFTFDESPVFISGTAVVLANLAGLVAAAVRFPASGGGGAGVAETVSSVWVVLSFWPFVRGLGGNGRFGLPWSTIVKAAIIVWFFVQLSIGFS